MNLIKKMISDKNELVDYQLAILNLFRKSYGRDLHPDIWKWAYLQNVNGNPIVSLYFDGGKLVAHYAVIPIIMKKEGLEFKACLAMTVMVDPDYRKNGLFVQQANDVFKKAEESGFDLVFGFPNKNVIHGYARYLGWTLDEKGCIACLSKNEIARYNKSIRQDYGKAQVLMNEDYLKWRLSKPDSEYFRINASIFKKYKNKIDLIYLDSLDDLDDDRQYNIYLQIRDGYAGKNVMEYVFGYRVFNDLMKDVLFKKDLILSDVF